MPWLGDLLGLVLGSGRSPVMLVALGSPLSLAQVVPVWCSDSMGAELGLNARCHSPSSQRELLSREKTGQKCYSWAGQTESSVNVDFTKNQEEKTCLKEPEEIWQLFGQLKGCRLFRA